MRLLNRVLFPARVLDRLCGKATSRDWYEPPVAAWFAVGIIYFAIFGRHRLILSPEEEFALARGETAYKAA